MYDFITIGGTTRDVSFFTDQGVLLDNRGDLLRQKLLAFESGAKIKVDKFYYSYGGGAANAAVCLRNLGLRAACLAPIGNDYDGRLIVKNLRFRGVDVSLLQKIAGEESSSSFILIAPSGERIIFAQRGANTHMAIGRSALAALKRTNNVYIASLAGNWLANLRLIFSTIGHNSHHIFWNPGMTQYLGGVKPIAAFLKKTTVLSSNKDEALQLVLASPKYRYLGKKFLDKEEKLIKIIHSLGPRIVVITLGADGVIAYDGHQLYRRGIIKEKKRVDTTGIGDVFNSSFAAGLTLYNGDIDRALDLSLKNAAAKVTHLGAQNGLLRLPRRSRSAQLWK
ncbi:MAG: carbohydrate kinase family protein [Patescibacteria group bacterium]